MRNDCHKFIFNDDGFEVCILCGTCTTLKEVGDQIYLPDSEISKSDSGFSYILVNHHIGYVKEIEEEFYKLKTKLKRGYPNLSLYAYCTYYTLLQNNVYYSLNNISKMFQITNFPKIFCQIGKNENIKKPNFDIMKPKYIQSSLNIFLHQYGASRLFKQSVKISKIILDNFIHIKPNFIISLSIYFTIKLSDEPTKNLCKELAEDFSINIRSLMTFVKRIEKGGLMDFINAHK